LFFSGAARAARALDDTKVGQIVATEVQRLMREHSIPGMAVALTRRGQRHFSGYGVASIESAQAVGERTVFEVGSITKTFTGLLGGYAVARGQISLSDPAGKYLPELGSSPIGSISLLDLATYTAGNLPLQFPAHVVDFPSMMAFYQGWAPEYPPGSYRRYSNPSIGLFGLLVSRGLGRPFKELMQQELFPELGLHHTYIDVPASEMQHYAYGYGKAGQPMRVTPGMLDAEAYGAKTTAPDLLRFIEAHLFTQQLGHTLRGAVKAATTAYYRVGPMQQGLGWEMYEWPVAFEKLLAGNSATMALEPNPASRLSPPVPPSGDSFVNKTGSTGGFGAYAAFVPGAQLGIVMLANKNYPNPARVKTAYQILKAVAEHA